MYRYPVRSTMYRRKRWDVVSTALAFAAGLPCPCPICSCVTPESFLIPASQIRFDGGGLACSRFWMYIVLLLVAVARDEKRKRRKKKKKEKGLFI